MTEDQIEKVRRKIILARRALFGLVPEVEDPAFKGEFYTIIGELEEAWQLTHSEEAIKEKQLLH